MMKRALLAVPLILAVGACGGDDDDAGGSSSGSDWCDMATQVEAQDNLFNEADFTDPDAVENAFTGARDLMEDAEDKAPDEIKEDVETVSNAFGTLVDELEQVDWNFMELDSAVLDDMGTEVQDASDRIAAYSEEECGIPADGGDSTDPTVSDEGDTDDSEATLPESGSINDMLVQQFTEMGMTEEQAQCLLDNIDINEFSQSQDTSMLMDAFSECDIDPTQLGG
jgi:hypothetical protein